MRIALLFAALALSGCAHVPLITSCITPAQLAEIERQAPPKIRAQLNGDAQHDSKILAASLVRHGAYESMLLDALRACS